MDPIDGILPTLKHDNVWQGKKLFLNLDSEQSGRLPYSVPDLPLLEEGISKTI